MAGDNSINDKKKERYVMAEVAKGRTDGDMGALRQPEDEQAKPPEKAVCESYLAMLGKPKDMLKIRAMQVTEGKYRINLWRRHLGITDYALVAVNENGTIKGVQKDRKKGKDSGIVKGY